VKFYSGQIDELQILYPHRYTQATETGAASVPQKKGKAVGNEPEWKVDKQPAWLVAAIKKTITELLAGIPKQLSGWV
jgi:hypothetical protein